LPGHRQHEIRDDGWPCTLSRRWPGRLTCWRTPPPGRALFCAQLPAVQAGELVGWAEAHGSRPAHGISHRLVRAPRPGRPASSCSTSGRKPITCSVGPRGIAVHDDPELRRTALGLNTRLQVESLDLVQGSARFCSACTHEATTHPPSRSQAIGVGICRTVCQHARRAACRRRQHSLSWRPGPQRRLTSRTSVSAFTGDRRSRCRRGWRGAACEPGLASGPGSNLGSGCPP
jgi:hypothetical protein